MVAGDRWWIAGNEEKMNDEPLPYILLTPDFNLPSVHVSWGGENNNLLINSTQSCIQNRD